MQSLPASMLHACHQQQNVARAQVHASINCSSTSRKSYMLASHDLIMHAQHHMIAVSPMAWPSGENRRLVIVRMRAVVLRSHRQPPADPLRPPTHLPQARERARLVSAAKRSRSLAAQRMAGGLASAKDDAVRVIQAGIRGALWRRRVKREADQELMFIGMKPQVGRLRHKPQLCTAQGTSRYEACALPAMAGVIPRGGDGGLVGSSDVALTLWPAVNVR